MAPSRLISMTSPVPAVISMTFFAELYSNELTKLFAPSVYVFGDDRRGRGLLELIFAASVMETPGK